MGDIIPFLARVRDSGDWTAGERARLDALVDQFAKSGIKVEVVYGVSEDGDPWCVIKDENEDVLLHVARIDGRFVVHQAADDSLAEASDLPAALGQQLALMDNPHDTVVPFAVGGRQLQTLIALLVATAFVYDHRETQAAFGLDLRAEPAPDDTAVHAAAAPPVDIEPRQERDATPHWAAAPEATTAPAAHVAWLAASETPAEPPKAATPASPAAVAEIQTGTGHAPAPAPAVAAPIQAPPPAPAAHVIVGGDHGEVLVGTAGADLIRGGAGDDTLVGGGAGPGQYDTLDGGAGDDRIEVTAQVVAIGGAGADTFVIASPKTLGQPGTFLGTILDFHPGEGDRLVNGHGGPVTFVTMPDSFRFHPPGPPPGVSPTATSTVFVDLNGDGKPDGFLFLGHGTPGPGPGPVEPVAPVDHGAPPSDGVAGILGQGQALGHPVLG